MGSIFNQYSFVVAAGFLLVILASILFRKGMSRRGWLVLAAAGLAVGLVWTIIRPQAGVTNEADDIRQQIAAGGIPTLVEFQSQY